MEIAIEDFRVYNEVAPQQIKTLIGFHIFMLLKNAADKPEAIQQISVIINGAINDYLQGGKFFLKL
jgi:hypothetical protein